MLSFRAITAADINTIKKYANECGIQSCDFTLSGIYLWGVYYGYEMCEYADTLFIKGRDESGRAAFACPMGEMDGRKAVALLLEYCENHNIEARFSFVPESVLQYFEGGSALKLVDWSDYVYDSASLATLSGKKLHKKKNRFNKFVKTYPNYRFEVVDDSNIDALRKFYKAFAAENVAENERLAAEERIIYKLLDEYSLLGLLGGLLWVEDRIVAFAIGERVGDTLYMHFEKANRAYDGAYEAMNSLFVRNFGADARFVNCEEDMGDEGLRQAKTAYCPVMKIDKYEIVY